MTPVFLTMGGPLKPILIEFPVRAIAPAAHDISATNVDDVVSGR
jgi:hypothetical protein